MGAKQDRNPGWMGERWLRYMLTELIGESPSRAQLAGARRAPTRLAFERGRVVATVGVGSQGRFHTATLKMRPMNKHQWNLALDAVAASPEATQQFLSGRFGPQVEAAFEVPAGSLFPEPEVMTPLQCTCPQRYGCRHIRALAVHGAAAIDANPFLWLQVLGRSREEALAALRARLADRNTAQWEAAAAVGTVGKGGATGSQSGAAGGGAGSAGAASADGASAGGAAAGPPQLEAELQVAHFWETPMDPDDLATPAEAGGGTSPDSGGEAHPRTDAAEIPLQRLGPLPLPGVGAGAGAEVRVRKEVSRWGQSWQVWEAQERPAHEVLQRYVDFVARAAGSLARREHPPQYQGGLLPGKVVPLKQRLAREVAAAVAREKQFLRADRLRTLCPTAAALPEEIADRALRHALQEGVPGLVSLAQRYVGREEHLLAGAAFRHVVTFSEWQAGRLSPRAEWVKLLQGLGHAPPYRVQVSDATFLLPLPDGRESGPDGLFGALQPEVGDAIWLTVVDGAAWPPVLAVARERRSERSLMEPVPTNDQAAEVLLDHLAATRAESIPAEEAMVVLLAEGFYRPGRCPDPIWLLPVQTATRGLYADELDGLTVELWRAGVTGIVRPPQWLRRQWKHQEEELRRFAAALAEGGWDRLAVEGARRCAEAWCHHYSMAQNEEQAVPPLWQVLDFLWNEAPRRARQGRLATERWAEFLETWFRFLAQRYPAMQVAYQPHMTACRLQEAYRHRLRTLPRGGTRSQEFLAWLLEGYRWIGAPEGERWLGPAEW